MSFCELFLMREEHVRERTENEGRKKNLLERERERMRMREKWAFNLIYTFTKITLMSFS